MAEILQLVRAEDRKPIGVAKVDITPEGNLSIQMRFNQHFDNQRAMRAHFRNRIEDYMGMQSWHRKHTFGDRNPHL